MFGLFLSARRRYLLAGTGAVFVIGIAAGGAVSPPAWATVASNPILFDFWLGMAVPLLFISVLALRPMLALATLGGGLAALVLAHGVNLGFWTQPLCAGMPCALILVGAISLERHGLPVPRLLVALGDSSYSLYLTHPFVLPLAGKLWSIFKLSAVLPPVALFILAFATAIVVGHLLYVLVERPISRRLSGPGRVVAAPVPTSVCGRG